MGLEIRDKVANYVGEKINSIRQNSQGAICSNTAIVRSNAMKTFTNYFKKDSVRIIWRLTFCLDRKNVLLFCNFSKIKNNLLIIT